MVFYKKIWETMLFLTKNAAKMAHKIAKKHFFFTFFKVITSAKSFS